MQEIERGALYVVGTPIGNLGDFSPRAVEILSNVDFIAAEDTRVTIKLLNHFEIKKPMISYFEHNKSWRGDEIIERLTCGESCALVSDAGMPAISDPGESLVAGCAEAGIKVYVVPGPTAAMSAIAISGLPTGRFTFEGFLSMNKLSRRERLASLKKEERTMIFYEAPHKLRKTLIDMLESFGDRRIALVKELTKIHENVWRTTLSEAARHYREVDAKGEFVLVIDGAKIEVEEEEYTLSDAVETAKNLMENGVSASEAAKEAAKLTGLKKGEIYKAVTSS